MNQTLNLKLEIKALNEREFEGYGSTFNNVDLVGDIVAPGAFKNSLAEHRAAGTMPLMFWMHRPDQVAGAWTAMKEDSKGLYVKGILAETQLGNEMRTLLAMKAVRGLSIGFRVLDRTWEDDEEHGAVRVIKEVDLVEVSIVSMAANPLADVTASKSRLSAAGEYVPTQREFEQTLRKSGYSRNTAERIALKVFDDVRGSLAITDQGEPDLTDVMQSLSNWGQRAAQGIEIQPVAEDVKPSKGWWW